MEEEKARRQMLEEAHRMEEWQGMVIEEQHRVEEERQRLEAEKHRMEEELERMEAHIQRMNRDLDKMAGIENKPSLAKRKVYSLFRIKLQRDVLKMSSLNIRNEGDH